MNDREIQEQIKALNKLKKDAPVKTYARRDINKKLRELKKRLAQGYNVTPRKQDLIDEIHRLEPNLRVKLENYSEEALEKHITLVKKKRGL